MRRLAAALAVALAFAGAPAARADDGPDWTGGCGYDAATQADVTGPDRFVGTIYAVVGMYSLPPGEVVSARVSCNFYVNGELLTNVSDSGTGVVAFAAPFEFTATDHDSVDICTEIDYLHDDSPTENDCFYYGEQLPPQVVIDLLDFVFGSIDSVVCDLFENHPQSTGPVVIEDDGDVYLDGSLFWDCPPYEPW